MIRSCMTCEHYSALQNQCRAKSPQPVIIPGNDGQPAVIGVFPSTHPDSWCGEWLITTKE